MQEAVWGLRDRGDREGGGAAAGRVDGHEDVLRVLARVAQVVLDGVGHALHERLDVRRVESLYKIMWSW